VPITLLSYLDTSGEQEEDVGVFRELFKEELWQEGEVVVL